MGIKTPSSRGRAAPASLALLGSACAAGQLQAQPLGLCWGVTWEPSCCMYRLGSFSWTAVGGRAGHYPCSLKASQVPQQAFICQTPAALGYEQPRQGCLWLRASPPAWSSVEVETAILIKNVQQQIPGFGISLNNWSQGQKRALHMGIVPQIWDRPVCSTRSTEHVRARSSLM